LAKGWKVKYIPIILAKGVCPDNQHSFFKQQVRWCSGSMSLLTSKEFWTAPISLKNKLPFLSGFMYYLASPLVLLLPFLNVFLLTNVHTMHDLWIGLYFLPSFVISLIMLVVYVYPKARLGTLLAHISAVWAYTYILLALLIGKKEAWQPSGSKGKISSSYYILTVASTLYLVVYAILVYLCAYFDKIQWNWSSMIILFWIFINFFIQLIYTIFQWSDLLQAKRLLPAITWRKNKLAVFNSTI
jgi:cellulose synthase/poly-beta-1,6-N-acetylglucosamine synthase-like glycosyltransferase